MLIRADKLIHTTNTASFFKKYESTSLTTQVLFVKMVIRSVPKSKLSLNHKNLFWAYSAHIFSSFGTLNKNSSAMIEISSELVQISSDLVEFSSEPV